MIIKNNNNEPYVRKEISPTLFALSAIALLLLASSPLLLLLSPFTMSVFAQRETGTGDDDAAATMASGATNETTTTAASPARNNMTGVQFLFIQSAQSGSVSEVNATTLWYHPTMLNK